MKLKKPKRADETKNHKDTKSTKIFYIFFVLFVSLWFLSVGVCAVVLVEDLCKSE
jgi:hypothetical protein